MPKDTILSKLKTSYHNLLPKEVQDEIKGITENSKAFRTNGEKHKYFNFWLGKLKQKYPMYFKLD